MTPYIEADSGWSNIINPLIERCNAEGATIHTIKEKFGGLRFYASGCSKELEAAIDAAENQSFHICEMCGQPGTLRRLNWIKTLCDKHHEERKNT